MNVRTKDCTSRCLVTFKSSQDTGISVRKRVIKILKDICMNQPNFSKIDEICVKIMKRINDEEGIKVCVETCKIITTAAVHALCNYYILFFTYLNSN